MIHFLNAWSTKLDDSNVKFVIFIENMYSAIQQYGDTEDNPIE